MNRQLIGSTVGDELELKKFVSFVIGERHYCIEITSVAEIKQWNGATALPNSAPHMRGVINLRGAIIPVIDLKALFGEGVTQPTPTHVVVIVAVADALCGLLVDGVSDIVGVAETEIAPLPPLQADPASNFFSGLIKGQDRLLAILDLDQLSLRTVAQKSIAAAA